MDEDARHHHRHGDDAGAGSLARCGRAGGAKFKLPMPLLWQHDSEQPIGHVTHAKVTKAGIEIVAKIARIAEPGRLKDRLDEAWQSIKARLGARLVDRLQADRA